MGEGKIRIFFTFHFKLLKLSTTSRENFGVYATQQRVRGSSERKGNTFSGSCRVTSF
ncbi:hypothetical protein SESBI_44332 [Sesbania bispinosa]|nr:hypothetical protein SESBI_44332 [Sesbania bispinosa]